MILNKEFKESFSYIYYEDVDRVYSCLTNKYVLNEIIFKDYISNINYNKDNVKQNDLEGIQISFLWKNNLNCELRIDENENKYENKKISISFIKINEYINPGKINFYFYWNSCEANTFFLIEIITKNSNIKDMILQKEINKETTKILFQKIENYIKYDYNCLIQFDSIIIERNIKDIFNYIKGLNKIIPFFYGNPNNIYIEHLNNISFGSILKVYESEKNIEYQYKISGVLISEDRICIQLNKKVNNEDFLSVKISIDKCDEETSSFFIKHQYKKYVNSYDIRQLSKKKKNCFKFLKKNLEIENNIE